MCGRITLTVPDLHTVAELLEADLAAEDAAAYRPRYNAAPTDRLFIAVLAAKASGARRQLVPARWGFPGGVINVRSETAARQPAFEQGRAIVPADGFFEWTGPKSARRPIWFRPRAGGLLYLAGLARPLPDGQPCFVVLTTEARGPIAEVHDRMPVLLPPARAREWLERKDSGLLVPAPEDFLTATEVSTRVNSVANDDPGCLEPPEPPPPRKQLSLL
jgi:putative SOS response-associated peptidase YedK